MEVQVRERCTACTDGQRRAEGHYDPKTERCTYKWVPCDCQEMEYGIRYNVSWVEIDEAVLRR